MADITKYTDEELMALADTDIASVLKSRGYSHGWYKEIEYVGYIYILVNPSINNMVKIGYATDVVNRMKSLYSSAVPDPYHCYAWYKVRHKLEDKTVHKLIDSLDPELRHSANREFYDMSPERAFEILSAVAQISGNDDCLVFNPLNDNYFAVKSKKTKKANSKDKKTANKGNTMKSRLTFGICNIPIGSELVYIKDPSIKVKTIDEINHIEYKGKEYSLSGFVKELTGWSAAQGGNYFTFRGKKLTDLRE